MLTKGFDGDIINNGAVFALFWISDGKMKMIYDTIDGLVGSTPLLRLKNTEKINLLSAELYGKIEFFNPAGSVKDRVALNMIKDAESRGLLPGCVIIEPTSGNTGIGLAAICASRGYRLIIVMPENMSEERKMLMRAYGAELVLTDARLGMSGAISRAEELQKEIPSSIIAGQFYNPANPGAHYLSTGPEIWEDTEGKVDIFVSCVGTGGTLSGTARYLKEKNNDIKVIAVEPEASPFISRGRAGAHKIQGIGAGFIPENLDISLVDEVVTVTDDEAFESAREVAKAEGILVGISSGAAVAAAKRVALREENKGKNIIVILPDTGERYLSSGLFE